MLEKIGKIFTVFTKITTFSFLGSAIYIMISCGPHTLLNLSYVWGILLIGIICALGVIPFMGDKEFSKKKMIVCRIFYALFVNVTVLAIGFLFKWILVDNLVKHLIGVEITIAAIYIILTVISYVSDYKQAKKMTELLKKRNLENV